MSVATPPHGTPSAGSGTRHARNRASDTPQQDPWILVAEPIEPGTVSVKYLEGLRDLGVSQETLDAPGTKVRQ